MKDKLIMTIEIETLERIGLKSEIGDINVIPFVGETKGELFTGKVAQGAVDNQWIDINGIKHMDARYMLVGKDSEGNDCKLYIVNQGFIPMDAPKPFKTIPKFFTDSKILGDYLHNGNFRGEGVRDESGLKIRIFEVIA